MKVLFHTMIELLFIHESVVHTMIELLFIHENVASYYDRAVVHT